MISYRRLNEVDLPAFSKIRLGAVKKHPEAFGFSYEEEATFAQSIHRDWITKHIIFGALENENIIGIIGCSAEQGVKRQHRCSIFSMYVEDQFRGQGIGSGLLRHMLDHVKGQYIQCHLGVVADNAAAIQLYKKLGFEVYGKVPKALKIDQNFYDECLMVKFLDC